MHTHGGKRDGSGRKSGSGQYGESTEVVRVPVSLKPAILTALKEYSQGRQTHGAIPAAFLLPATSPPKFRLPLYAHRIPAGFPSPAEDYVEDRLDLNELLVKRQEATYFLRVKGDSMVGAGIHPGDLIIVDRSVDPQDGHVVVAEVNGELTVKRLRWVSGLPELHPENPVYPVIRFKDGEELRIWGVVTNAVHAVR